MLVSCLWWLALLCLIVDSAAYLTQFLPLAFNEKLRRQALTNFQTRMSSANSSCGNVERCGGHPLVIVPSLIGNQLAATLNSATVPHFWCYSNSKSYRIWIDVNAFLPYSPFQSCMWSDLTLDYSTGRYESPSGVNVSVPFFGRVEGIKYLDTSSGKGKVPIWAPIIDHLTEHLNYTPNKDIVAATYDWRKGPDATSGQHFVDLKNLIEQTYANNGNMRVVLASLSMGGPRSARFLMAQPTAWKAKYIKHYVSFSGAFGGSLFGPLSQISAKSPLFNRTVASFDGQLAFKAVRNFGAIAYMWPNKYIFDKNETFVTMDTKRYTASDFEQLAADAQVPNGRAMLKAVTQPQYQDFSALNINVTCIYGTGVPTTSKIGFSNGDWTSPTSMEQSVGDGTVLSTGLENACRKWNATMVPIKGLVHGQGMFKPEAFTVLLSALGTR